MKCFFNDIWLSVFTVTILQLSSTVCEGGTITLQCRVMLSGRTVPGIWRRDGLLIDDNSTLSNHFIVPYNSTGQELVGLIITNVSVADNGTELSCTFFIIDSASVTLQVVGMF